MEKVVSAADANRRFSELLRRVKEGESYVVTSHGKRVARIIPADAVDNAGAKARSSLFSRLRKQRPVKSERWTRDELYERER